MFAAVVLVAVAALAVPLLALAAAVAAAPVIALEVVAALAAVVAVPLVVTAGTGDTRGHVGTRTAGRAASPSPAPKGGLWEVSAVS